jgi:hypothetical protein
MRKYHNVHNAENFSRNVEHIAHSPLLSTIPTQMAALFELSETSGKAKTKKTTNNVK